MFKLIIAFVVLAVLIHTGIGMWQSASGKERWNLTKSLGYSIIVSLLAIAGMTLIVVLF